MTRRTLETMNTESRRAMVRLLEVRVWSHGEQRGHSIYVRGLFPRRVWRCARHDCDWSFQEAEPRSMTLVVPQETP